MREISFVKRLKFNFNGSVTKRALVIGDADNDQHNEIVCANLQGDLAIFKQRNSIKFAYASNLGMVTACVIGDVINTRKNYVTAINMEGWLFIFEVTSNSTSDDTGSGCQSDNPNCDDIKHGANVEAIKLDVLYDQRMPSNCKELLLADLDGDGQNELIIGLTDRVLRTYKWIKIGHDRGKFVGLYKWEFADQIGSVSLNPSRHHNCQDIIVAQPGGTYAKLECFDKKPLINSNSTSGSSSEAKQSQQPSDGSTTSNLPGSPNDGDNVKTEYISKLTPEYHQLALAQMRNHHVSTEVLGGIRNGKDSALYSLIVIATLDGTLMLVNKDEILWSLQVDHQLFALAVIESRHKNCQQTHLPQSESTCTIVPNIELNDTCLSGQEEKETRYSRHNNDKMSQYFVVCAWNGKTYIIDEERNYLRFKFDEAVSAFTAGNYYFDGMDHACLVYATFNNRIILYYDVVSDHIRPDYLLNEIMNNPDNHDILEKLNSLSDILEGSRLDQDSQQEQRQSAVCSENQRVIKLHNLLQDVLYSVSEDELSRRLCE